MGGYVVVCIILTILAAVGGIFAFLFAQWKKTA